MFVSGDTTPWTVSTLQDALQSWKETLSEISKVLTNSPQSFGGGVIYDSIKTINGAMQSIALGLLVIFILIGIVKKSTDYHDMKKPEAIFKLLLRFVIGKAVISYGMPLLTEIFSVGLGIISKMGVEQIVSNLEIPEAIITAAQDANFWEKLLSSVLALVASFGMSAISIAILLTVYGRMFKVYMYIAISPIPLSTFAGEGTSRIGVSFLKSFAGVCLEGALIALACVIYTKYLSAPNTVSFTSGGGEFANLLYNYIINTVFSMFILFGTIKACDRITREMMGL